MPDSVVPDGDRGCGARLRQARESAGLSEADVATRLKMPVRVVQSLEAEDWSRLGAPVFVRGQLRSYSRLLGLATAPVHAASGVAPVEPPVLVPRTYTPPMQRLAEQLARRFVYVVLTIAIAVPVWLATRPHLGIASQDAAPLDVHTFGAATGNADVTASAASDEAEPSAVVASLTALPSRPVVAPALSLRFKSDSWFEVTASDGHALEQSLVRAGQQRSYASGAVSRIVIGNAAAVDVQRNGQVQDLTPYLRANVARFTVSSDGSLAPAVD
ncbi:MAG TPA: RodZ domain-containing protein [Luteimonas sp.]|nr:RodZ domain-containing protein [Luteimonas sp.]